jgi:hypothetical protein
LGPINKQQECQPSGYIKTRSFIKGGLVHPGIL